MQPYRPIMFFGYYIMAKAPEHLNFNIQLYRSSLSNELPRFRATSNGLFKSGFEDSSAVIFHSKRKFTVI